MAHPVTVTRSLAETALTDVERRKVDRYLDATRSSLLFARRVILVEGIAEVLLVRALGRHLLYRDDPDIDPDERTRIASLRGKFAGLTIVPVGGVDFAPFLRLLVPPGAEPLPDRVAVVTDGDGGLGDERRTAMEKAFADHVGAGVLDVSVCDTTLEAEMFASPGNEGLLRQAYLAQHPRSAAKWDRVGEGVTLPEERAKLFADALKPGGIDLGKGEFAHLVAELIAQGEPTSSFTVPTYLLQAVRHVIEEPRETSDGTSR